MSSNLIVFYQTTDRSELSCGGSTAISQFLEGVLMEDTESKISSEFELQIDSTCSIRTLSRTRDILKLQSSIMK